MSNRLIKPHGGKLVNLLVSGEREAEIKEASKDWVSWDLTSRQFCDLELLISGGFSPLKGFMNKKDYESVCSSMHLTDGTLWPIPIILDVTEDFAKKIKSGNKLALRDPEGVLIASLDVEDIWKPDRGVEENIFYVY